MPKPTEGETEKDYMNRCMGDDQMVGEFADEKQRFAVCQTKWADKDKQTMSVDKAEIKGKVIAYAGNFGKDKLGRDKSITEKDLDDMVANFGHRINDPALTIDHDDKFTDKIKDALKVMRLGTVSRLYKEGGKLMADFKDVPAKIADLINDGMLSQRSIEMFKTIERAGKQYKNVLHAVSFFGKDLPAIPNLDDYIPALYDANGEGNGEVEKYLFEATGKVDKYSKEIKMSDKVEINLEEYNKLRADSADLTKFKADKENADFIELKQKVLDQDGVILTFKSDNERLKKVEKEFVTFKLEVEQAKEAADKEEAVKFASDGIAAKKIIPAYKDDVVADYLRFKKEDPERLVRFKKEIEARTELMPGAVKYGDEGSNVDPKAVFHDEAALERAIKYKMNKENISWIAAHDAILANKED